MFIRKNIKTIHLSAPEPGPHGRLRPRHVAAGGGGGGQGAQLGAGQLVAAVRGGLQVLLSVTSCRVGVSKWMLSP